MRNGLLDQKTQEYGLQGRPFFAVAPCHSVPGSAPDSKSHHEMGQPSLNPQEADFLKKLDRQAE